MVKDRKTFCVEPYLEVSTQGRFKHNQSVLQDIIGGKLKEMNKAQEEVNARFRDSDILMLTYFTYLLITKLRISKNTNSLGAPRNKNWKR